MDDPPRTVYLAWEFYFPRKSNSAAAEESAAASEELSAQAESLNQLMNQFKI